MSTLKEKLLARKRHRAKFDSKLLQKAWDEAIKQEQSNTETSRDELGVKVGGILQRALSPIASEGTITRASVENALQDEWQYVQRHTSSPDHHRMWDIKTRLIEAITEAANAQLAGDNQIILGKPSEPPPEL